MCRGSGVEKCWGGEMPGWTVGYGEVRAWPVLKKNDSVTLVKHSGEDFIQDHGDRCRDQGNGILQCEAQLRPRWKVRIYGLGAGWVTGWKVSERRHQGPGVLAKDSPGDQMSPEE
jgi:hypothetical protein